MKVPQFLPWVTMDDYEAVRPCFERNWITEGPAARDFVEALLKLSGARHGVLAPNGTLAIYLALRALGIGPGDEVLVPDFTFIGSATAVQMAGAVPVFTDVNPDNFQIDTAAARACVTEKTRAVMPVHIYGTVADMDAVAAFAREQDLLVVEDAAQAVGVRYKGRHAGTFGNAGTFSFFADKTITTAEGGMVVTDDPETFDRLRHLRNQGRIDRGTFIHPEMGYNFRMTDIQAALGLSQLARLPEVVERKQAILGRYREQLSGRPGIRFFAPGEGAGYIPFRVSILCEGAHELMAHLSEKGIEPRSFFYPLHRQPAFAYLRTLPGYPGKLKDRDFPNACAGYDQGVMLPCYPGLSPEAVDYTCETIRNFLAAR